MNSKEIYIIIFEYLRNLILKYEDDLGLLNNLSAEELYNNDVLGLMIQQLGFSVLEEYNSGHQIISFKFSILSIQSKQFDDIDKIKLATYLSEINSFIDSEVEKEKPKLPDNCKFIDFTSFTSGISEKTDNSISYKSDYEFLYKIKKQRGN